MSGTIAGGKAAAATNKAKYGEDFYRKVGAKGGAKSNPRKGFGSHRQLAAEVGSIGGRISKRGPSQKKLEEVAS